METLITNIRYHSNPSLIIITQADYGPGVYLDWNSVEKTNLDERMSIPNAYYFPGDHPSFAADFKIVDKGQVFKKTPKAL